MEFYEKLDHDPFENFENIINSLNKVYSNGLIVHDTVETLKLLKAKPGQFYLLPKIHKKDNPGRPVISSINCHTMKI